jgi:hypothetical protein
VKLEEIKRAKDRRPFEPFLLRMADGRELRVTHPDAIAWELDVDEEDDGEAEEPLTVTCIVPGGARELILVASLVLAPAQPGRKGKGKGKDRGG